MSPSVDTPQVAIADSVTTSTSCSAPLTTSVATDVCSEAVIPTNSLTEENEAMSVLESDPIESEKEVFETSEDTTAEDPSNLPEKESEETPEIEEPTQQNETSEETVVPKKDETEVPKEEETTADEVTETPKEEVEEEKDSSEEPESKPPNPEEDDIEWLTPFTLPKVKSGEEIAAEDDAASASTTGRDNPLKMLKKGAVAAVGGSMVGLGLVMIPLPTPFGAVVASSGLAVLGTEFKEAKDLNDSLIDGAKGHLSKARDSIVKGIEKMNEEDIDDVDIPDISNNSTIQSKDSSVETEETEGGAVIKMNAAKTLKRGDSNADSSVGDISENSESGSASEPPPVWLHMNPIERMRQERLAKQKYRRDRQTSYEQAKEAMTKRTGQFLSKTILPFIKKAEPTAEAATEEVAETVEEPTTTTTPMPEGETVDAEKGEDLQTEEKETAAEVKTKDPDPEVKTNEGEAITTTRNDNESEGYVVVS